MVIKNKSEKRAREILSYYVESVTEAYDEAIEAILLVGSLSNGSYVEGPGRDIDQITVLKDTASEDIKYLVYNHINCIESKFNNDIPISTTVFRLSEMKRPFKTDFELCLENKHFMEITTELMRIHESGILIYGTDIIKELPLPTSGL